MKTTGDGKPVSFTMLDTDFVQTSEAPKDHVLISPEMVTKLLNSSSNNGSVDIFVHSERGHEWRNSGTR